MSEQIDIITLDSKIRTSFIEEIDKLDIYKDRLNKIHNILSTNSNTLKPRFYNILKNTEKELEKYIVNLTNQSELNFYIISTSQIIEEYTELLKKPLKINFLGKPSKSNKTKSSLIKKFINIAQNYVNIDISKSTNSQDIIYCKNCGNKKDFDIIDTNIYICQKCFSEQIIMKHVSSYNDIDRINISSKYMYDRKIHFRDCIKQYQGKQNSTIPDKIYKDIEAQFSKHHLLIDSPIKEEKFKNITKNHILLFLKELGYSNHYENVHLIHYNFTGIKPDDISYLEEQLLDDFDSLTDLYDKNFKNINRKNFINTQYVLYQLLQRHKHKCNKEEFIILKTIDRKFFHDEVCKTLFEQLGWNHTPFY
jgi:hypothetical protein